MQKNKKLFVLIIIFLILVMAFSFAISSFLIPKVSADGETSAKAMCVIESSTGRVLKSKNKDEKLAMASTTKIMTALVTIKNVKDLNEIVNINDNAVGIEGTSMYLRKGEKLTVKELLLGLMLPSGNDAAVALAYHVGGSEENFVKMMNEEAKSLKLENTSFANPHGLDAEGHYTSAYDLALIASEAMKLDEFKEICRTKHTQVTGSKINEPRFLSNKNKLLKTLDGCNGVKTGFTDNAGRCFVGSCERNGMNLICVVLNCGPMFEDCAKLLEECFNQYEMRQILTAYSKNDDVKVNNGEKEFVATTTKKGFSYPLTKEEFAQLKFVKNIPNSINATVNKNEIVGELEIYLENNLLFKENIYTIEEVKSTKYLDKIWEVVDEWNI